MKKDALYEKGLKLRKAVLGKDHVERSIRNADKYSMPMQELTTKHAWGMVWSRPGLPHKTRSIANLAILVALNMPEELELNLKAALRIGLTRDEIVELLVHTSLFCGYPAAIRAFRVASKVFADEDSSRKAVPRKRRV